MAQQTAIILNQDGFAIEVTYNEKESLATLQAAVGGRIESISQHFGMDAYANEEGLYTPGLQVNPHAAHVLGYNIIGNIVLPRITPTKRKRLIAKGFAIKPE